MKRRRIAILGAGIMGGSLALAFARRGIPVVLYDAAESPMACASRWNEGKIHLGFMYNRDDSLRTARQVLPGGLSFKPLLEELIGCGIDAVSTEADDNYLCHRDSVVAPDAMEAYFHAVAGLIREHPGARHYLADVSSCRVERMSPGELSAITDAGEILAGFRIPERSVSTRWVADRYVEALEAEPLIELRMGCRVSGARPASPGEVDCPWRVESAGDDRETFDHVVNALWEGRLPIDMRAGLTPTGVWSNRYRLALFIRASEAVDMPCAVVATGPFGDIKNYNGRDFYLSWYPSGLRLDSPDLSPPPPPSLDAAGREDLQRAILDNLQHLFPGVAGLRDRIESVDLRGGWVFAMGRGDLSNPESSLHRRADFGVFRLGAYLSVDTGKYSTAPWLARNIVDSLVA